MGGTDEQSHYSSGSSVYNSDILLTVENMGGIESANMTLSRGVTVFVGQNATNRTSLLRALAGVLGGETGILRRGSDEGSVTLVTGNEQYNRRYVRRDGSVRVSGTPYTDETELVDLFVALFEQNPIRRAVRAGENVEELLLRPVDTEELESEIETLQAERDRIDERLNEIKREQKRLPKLEQERQSLESEFETVTSELESVRERVASFDAEIKSIESAESLLDELEALQTEFEETESEIEVQRSVREELQENVAEIQEKLSGDAVHKDDLEQVRRSLDRLQSRESELSTSINELAPLLKQNERRLDGTDTVLEEFATDETPLDVLDPERQSLECWTCGSEVERRVIEDHLAELRALLDEKRQKRRELRDERSELQTKQNKLEEQLDTQEKLRRQQATIEQELESRTESIEELQTKAESLREDIAATQADLEELGYFAENEIAEEYERLSQLEYERGRLESELQEITEEIDEIEDFVGKREALEAQQEDVSDRLRSLRSRREQLRRQVVEQFNTHTESILERLEYRNIERVWFEWREKAAETTFDLHVVRKDESDTVYGDTLDHLSESEREVIGLVVGLAGYLVHDVDEAVPFMLLDSLEAIDAGRIREVVSYFESHVEFLLVALLEEDAAGLPDSCDRVRAEETLL